MSRLCIYDEDCPTRAGRDGLCAHHRKVAEATRLVAYGTALAMILSDTEFPREVERLSKAIGDALRAILGES